MKKLDIKIKCVEENLNLELWSVMHRYNMDTVRACLGYEMNINLIYKFKVLDMIWHDMDMLLIVKYPLWCDMDMLPILKYPRVIDFDMSRHVTRTQKNPMASETLERQKLFCDITIYGNWERISSIWIWVYDALNILCAIYVVYHFMNHDWFLFIIRWQLFSDSLNYFYNLWLLGVDYFFHLSPVSHLIAYVNAGGLDTRRTTHRRIFLWKMPCLLEVLGTNFCLQNLTLEPNINTCHLHALRSSS